MTDGKVVALFVGPVEGGPIESRDEVSAVAGRGLEGDRYFRGEDQTDHDPTEEVTLFESEGIREGSEASGLEIAPRDMRRNIMTEGVNLRDLIGKRFSVGEVELEGLEDNPPCDHLQSLAGKPLLKPMIERGGIRARIVTGGKVVVGDLISTA